MFKSSGFMTPRTLKLLIAGIALLIFGPVLGWLASMFNLFHTTQAMTEMGRDALPHLSRFPSRMIGNLIPLFIGVLCGAAGLFLTLVALIIHRFRPQARDEQRRPHIS